jgi:hypothetical protein
MSARETDGLIGLSARDAYPSRDGSRGFAASWNSTISLGPFTSPMNAAICYATASAACKSVASAW